MTVDYEKRIKYQIERYTWMIESEENKNNQYRDEWISKVKMLKEILG